MPPEQQWLIIILIVLIVVAIRRRGRWRGTGNAHGTASWANMRDLQGAGFFGKQGLLLGRTLNRGLPLRIRDYVHFSVFAPTGAGKGVSFVVPTLMEYTRGSVFVFDPKGELFKLTAKKRAAMGQRIIRLDPFEICGPGGDSFNPLMEIDINDPRYLDDARALGEAMVVRQPDERDPFWSNSAVNLLTAMLVMTLTMKEEDRNLSTVRELLTDPDLFKETIKKLQGMGGVPARLGGMLAKQSESEKESAGVISTANTHTAFLDSNLIAPTVNTSTFSADVLLQPGTTIYFCLPVEQLDAQRNFLRLLVSTLLRHVMRHGVKNGGETLFLLDEAASLGNLEALSQALQLGRGLGVRLYLFWQTAEQPQNAFKSTPNLVSDNCDAKIYFGTNSLPTAELISKALGNWTMTTSSYNESASGGRSHSPDSPNGGRNSQRGWSQSMNLQEHGRALLDPAEVLQLHPMYFIAFLKGCPPILGRRILYYADPLFRKKSSPLFWIALVIFALFVLWCFNPR